MVQRLYVGLPDKTPEEIIELANEAEDIAVEECPVDTGLLSSTIYVQPDDSGFEIGYSGVAEYWKYIEPEYNVISGAVGEILEEL